MLKYKFLIEFYRLSHASEVFFIQDEASRHWQKDARTSLNKSSWTAGLDEAVL